MDLPSHYDGSQVLLRVRDRDRYKESLVFSAAGMLGLDGLNSDGIGICCNTLAQLRMSASGLPVTFTLREVLVHSTPRRRSVSCGRFRTHRGRTTWSGHPSEWSRSNARPAAGVGIGNPPDSVIT